MEVDTLEVSLLWHFVTSLSYLGVAIYTAMYRRLLRRTSRRSNLLFFSILAVCLFFTIVSLTQLVSEWFSHPVVIISTPLDMIADYGALISQSLLLILLITNKIVVQSTPRPGRALAVGAHPDDLEIAAGATLARMHDAGYWMAGLILSQGGKGGQASERLVEASQGGQFLGLDEIQVLDFPDTHLKDQAAEMTQAIEAMLVKVKPDIVFTHSRHDLHQDHQAVYEATLRAARNQAITILCYESPSVTQEFDPVYFVPVDPYADVKVEAMREHWDQHNKSYMKPEVVRGKLIFRGSQAKVDLAEGFEVVRMISSF